MNTTEQTSDPTLWRYPEFYHCNRRIHIDNLEAKVAELEAQIKHRNETISGLEHEAEMWDEFMSPFTKEEGDEAPWITMKHEFERLLEQLEEARWLLTHAGDPTWSLSYEKSKDWMNRRHAWLSAHTPTGKEK